MKNILIATILAISIGGCTTARVKPVPLEQQIVKQTEYVIKIPPPQLMTLPPAVPNINVDASKQSDVAAWLLQKEQYTRSLENQLKDIATFFNAQQAMLDQAAKTQNIQLQETATEAQTQEQADADKKKVDLNAKEKSNP